MQIKLNLKKKLEQSANEYFEEAKKNKKKAEKAKKIVEQFKQKLKELDEKQETEIEQVKTIVKRQTEWYEKFRWFISSEGFLCIGGRDATTNEIVVKKHTDKEDIVFHTEAPGSPFFVIKTGGKKPGEATIQETADATASFSRAWKMGLPAVEVFSVNPEQVSKTAQSGEYLAKGAFMVRGKRNLFNAQVKLAVGKLETGVVMCAPEQAVKANCKDYIMIEQGKDKPSDVAKKIAKKLNAEVDDVLRVMPAGGMKINQNQQKTSQKA